ncbi:uncharacterized protein LOC116417380 isoform X2 [Nasonia vitripennis]|uniref:Uncharacterized protein n=1 Tax=Nasonia vitripennis TaxID=7425 RepID=A0A7M7TA26_NASVI|nr:uncharacterized protein LOC116417380 isoform X2 [Nasonia vitripennis]
MEFEYILERAYAVARLPPEKIPDGFMHITSLVIDPAVLRKLQDFAAYLRRFWLPLANVLSVYKKPVRSNNTCENFHLYAAKGMGERSNVYKMLDVMKEQMGKISRNFEIAEAGLLVTTHQPQRLIEADLAIRRAEFEFEVGREFFWTSWNFSLPGILTLIILMIINEVFCG